MTSPNNNSPPWMTWNAAAPPRRTQQQKQGEFLMDGRMMDHSSMKQLLFQKDQVFQSIIIRNVSLDRSLVQGILRSLQQQQRNSNQKKRLEICHCTGRLAELAAQLPSDAPLVEWSWTGSVPVAHNPRYTLRPSMIPQQLQQTIQVIQFKGSRCNQATIQAMSQWIASASCLHTLSLSNLQFTSPLAVHEHLIPAILNSSSLQTLLWGHCKWMAADHSTRFSASRRRRRSNHDDSRVPQESFSSSEDDENDNISEQEDNVSLNQDQPGEGEEQQHDHPAQEEQQHDDDDSDSNFHVVHQVPLRQEADRPPLVAPLLDGWRRSKLSALHLSGMRVDAACLQTLTEWIAHPSCSLQSLSLKNNVQYLSSSASSNNNNNEEEDNDTNQAAPAQRQQQQQERHQVPTAAASNTLEVLPWGPFFQALATNTSLLHLHIAGNNVQNDSMHMLGQSLQTNTTLQGLSMPANNIDDEGLQALTTPLPQWKGLRFLDLHRNPATSTSTLAKVLEQNWHLERLDLDGPYDERKAYWLALNKGGRQILLRENVPLGVWPFILQRVNRLPFGRPCPHRHLDVLYYLLQHGPALFWDDDDGDETNGTSKKRSVETGEDGVPHKRQKQS